MKAGNVTLPDPVEGSGMSNHGTVEGKHDENIESQFRVNETTTDSGVGETISADELYLTEPPH